MQRAAARCQPVVQTEAEILCLVANSNEFENIKVRDDEIGELEELLHDAWSGSFVCHRRRDISSACCDRSRAVRRTRTARSTSFCRHAIAGDGPQ